MEEPSREEIIHNAYSFLVDMVTGSTLYNKETDLENIEELVVAVYYYALFNQRIAGILDKFGTESEIWNRK